MGGVAFLFFSFDADGILEREGGRELRMRQEDGLRPMELKAVIS